MGRVKIGRIDEYPSPTDKEWKQWRFVVAESEEVLLLYAGVARLHRAIVQQNRLDPSRVMGGGLMTCVSDRLIVDDLSLEFGIVPNSAICEISDVLLEAMKNYNVRRLVVDMKYSIDLAGHNEDTVKKWILYGYNFDGKKRAFDRK